MSQRVLKVIGAAGAVAILATACSSGSGGAMSGTRRPASVSAEQPGPTGVQVGSPGADLRVSLSTLLQEHVYLTGIVTGIALSGEDPAAASATLDANTVKLGDELGSVWGTATANQFLVLWRAHTAEFAAYARAAGTNDGAGMVTVTSDLATWRAAFGAFIASANPNLPKEAVAAELVPYDETLLAVIDAQAAGNPGQYATLSAAAEHMAMTATLLASGIARQFPQRFGG